jgi:hypothetical protein
LLRRASPRKKVKRLYPSKEMAARVKKERSRTKRPRTLRL